MYTKKAFVTVGTTKFPKLIDAISTRVILDILSSLGYDFIQLQTGNEFSEDNLDPNIIQEKEISVDGTTTVVKLKNKITLKYDPYFENFEKEIESSDLVISHAGAGTCLEVLRKRKPLIVVVNEDLMDNHQIELAEELQNNGHLYYCSCDSLGEVLKKDISNLRPYPEPDNYVFSDYLNKCMGFIE